MHERHTYSLKSILQVYRLPEDASAQQRLVERAEEDLLSALSLYRRGACSYKPVVTVCFLLHQTLEKWLKVFIAVQGIPVSDERRRPHDLYIRFQAAEEKEPAFKEIRQKIEEVEFKITDQKFPGGLRYNETPPEVEQYIGVLIETVFATRRLVKRRLTENAMEDRHETS